MTTPDDRGVAVAVLPVAPVWHTCALLAIVAVFSGFFLFVRAASAGANVSHVALYSVGIALEWSTFAMCLWRTDPAFVAYVGCASKNPRRLARDILGAAVLAGVLLSIAPVVVRLLGRSGWGSTVGMLPATPLEVGLWVVLAASAGICEETVFRGYLQQQLSGWTGSVAAGIVGQGVIFGAAHAYQGFKKVALIMVWGWVFGSFVWLFRGLRANMIAHAVIDLLPIL